jgi:ribosomal protein S18 acetylase RimI-like enzyme
MMIVGDAFNAPGRTTRVKANELLTAGLLTLRRATGADADGLSRFAAGTFVDAFGAQNDLADVEAYVAAAFSPAAQAVEIGDAAAYVVLADVAEPAGRSLVGYAHLLEDPGGSTGELKRLYVDARWHGSGLARLLIDEVIAECRRRGATRLRLGVWERNSRAIAFYEKVGFRVTAKQTFKLGEDTQTDLVMELDVAGRV